MKDAWVVTALCMMVLAGTEPTLAAPPGAVPVYCTGIATESAEGVLTCRRADTRAVVTPVPESMFLHITDIVVNPNNVATSGTYSVILGRDDAGEYPNVPKVDLLGEAAGSYHFSTPYLVFRDGEDLAARVDSNSVLMAVDIRASGYLASQASP